MFEAIENTQKYVVLLDDTNTIVKGTCKVHKTKKENGWDYLISNLKMHDGKERRYTIHGIGYNGCNRSISTPQGVKCYRNNTLLGMAEDLPTQHLGQSYVIIKK